MEFKARYGPWAIAAAILCCPPSGARPLSIEKAVK